MDFIKAMKLLRKGEKVKCVSWDNKDFYIQIKDEKILDSEKCPYPILENTYDLNDIFEEWEVYVSEADLIENNMKFEILKHCVKISDCNNESNCILYNKNLCEGCNSCRSIKKHLMLDKFNKSELIKIYKNIKESIYE